MNMTISMNLIKVCCITLLLSMIHTSHAQTTLYYQSTASCPCGVINSVYGYSCASCGTTYTYSYPSTSYYTYPSTTYTGSLTYGGYSGYRSYWPGMGIYVGGGRVVEEDGHDYWGGSASTW